MNRHILDFLQTTRELLESDQVRMMGRWKHHGPISTLDHSLFVAYLSYRAAKVLGLDARAAAGEDCSTTCICTTLRISPPIPAGSALTIRGRPLETPGS